MARKLRLEFAGACYHVLNRGNYRRPLFAPADVQQSFYRCLDEACTSFGWLVHAFAIMSNHFHLTLETLSVEQPRAVPTPPSPTLAGADDGLGAKRWAAG